jgi:hypothetical protein
MVSFEIAPEDNHQARMARYLDSTSFIVFESLYCIEEIVLVLHIGLDVLLCVLLQQCSPV